MIGLLWLAAVYPASVGPARYCQERGWLSSSMTSGYETPVYALFSGQDSYAAYVRWWDDLGYYHRTGKMPIYFTVRIKR